MTKDQAWAERDARRNALIGQHGLPEHILSSEALKLARVEVTDPSDFYASIYRDKAAADAWMGSTLEHEGHPALARVDLPDGRVVGIYDLRPALTKEGRP
jgi:hypothetical protein